MDKNCLGKNLVLLGTSIALHLSENLNATQMNILGALLNVVGDQLSLLAATAEESRERAGEGAVPAEDTVYESSSPSTPSGESGNREKKP